MNHAFVVGLSDSVTPCVLAILLCLSWVLAIFAKTKTRCFVFGLLFVLIVLLMNVVAVLGVFDIVTVFIYSVLIIRIIFIAFSIILFLVGLKDFRDWVLVRKHSDEAYFEIGLPVYFNWDYKQKYLQKKKNIIKTIFCYCFVMFLIVVLAGVLSLASLIWSNDYEIYVEFFHLKQMGESMSAWLSVGSFALGRAMVLVVFWMSIFLCMNSQGICKKFENNISLIKIILSGFNMVLAGGLFYWFVF